MSERKRILSFDLLKLLALFAVIDSHFVAEYAMDVRENIVIGHLLNGFTGKFGVIVFALLAGYFSYASANKNRLSSYLWKRYLFFFSCCLTADLCFYLFNVSQARENSSLGMLVSQIVLLGDYYCDTFWFIRDFLIGSFLSFLIGKYHVKRLEILLLVLVLFYMNQPFIACYVAGCLLYEVQEEEIFKRSYVRVLLLCFFMIFFLFRRKESLLVYFEDLLRAFALSLFMKHVGLNFGGKVGSVIEKLSSMSMALIIGHVFAFHLCSLLSFSKGLNVTILYLLWLLLSFVTGIVFEAAIRLIYKGLVYLSGKMEALL